jgi:excisionase family DNA binding protein
MNEQLEELIDVKEAARIFGVSSDTIYKLARTGVIPCVRVGDLLRFDRFSLAQWIRNRNEKNGVEK